MAARGGVIVVGGGAAGMVAAISAARRGAAVTLLERLPRVGKKLLATGNGRCNLANARPEPGRYHGRDPGFAAAALAAFDLDATLRFFAELGIATREEDGGKIFPRSGQASSVLDVLRCELARLGVEIHCEAAVTSLSRQTGSWEVATRAGSFRGDAVVLASGGRASPQLGSNGSGYALALALGHRLISPFPALTRIRVASPFLKHLKGVKVEGVATLVALGRDHRRDKRLLRGPESSAAGEILFTETGLSGPPILDLSRRAGERVQNGEPTLVQLDLCPEFAASALEAILRERFAGHPVVGGDQPRPYDRSRSEGEDSIPAPDGSRSEGEDSIPAPDGSRSVGADSIPAPDGSRSEGEDSIPAPDGSRSVGAGLIPAPSPASAEFALIGFLHKRLIAPVLKAAGIVDPTRPAGSLAEPEIAAVAAVLKKWSFEVTGTDSWTDAQVTAGGVDVADVFPETLESRLALGLFFAGEVLDIDGDCGGFNLQWAWSSGHLAGAGAAQRALKSPRPRFAAGGSAP